MVLMNNLSSRRARILLIATLTALYIPAIYILCLQYNTSRGWSPTPFSDRSSGAKTGSDGPYNSTLGFEKIFYISMPGRTDRQDAMTLVASYMGLDFTMVPGVDGATIPEKALPYNPKHKPPKAPTTAEIGCWRAHANIWSTMLTTGLTSALILEDDTDFSTGIHHILSNVSHQLSTLTHAPAASSPYGLTTPDTWDVLSLGHCWNEAPPRDTHPVSAARTRTWEDPFAPVPPPHTKSASRVRAIHPTYVVVCTHGYAVSRAGARRLLHLTGGGGGSGGTQLYEALDIVMMNLFRSGRLRGWTVVPSVFGQWKNGDSGDSDIQVGKKGGKADPGERGSGGDVVGSVREEMGRVWRGRNVWKEMERQGGGRVRRRGGPEGGWGL